MGIRFYKVISDKIEMRIDRKLGGSTLIKFCKTPSEDFWTTGQGSVRGFFQNATNVRK